MSLVKQSVNICRHASPEVPHKAVEDALLCSHVHPEGIEGAYIQAAAVAALCTCAGPASQGTCAASTLRQLLWLPSVHALAQCAASNHRQLPWLPSVHALAQHQKQLVNWVD